MSRKIISALIAMTCATALTIACVNTPKQNPSSRTPAYTYGNSGTEGTHPLTFEKLLALIRENRFQTVTEALEKLTREHPEQFFFRTQMYDSNSLQGATLLEPRIIAYGPDAKFVLTFNGGAHQRGGYSFETMEFDEKKNGFLFREIAFKKEMKARDRAGFKSDEIAFENQDFIVTHSNPMRCIECHGYPAAPIWDTYFQWPGAYGSNDDFLTSIFYRTDSMGNANFRHSIERQGSSLGRGIQLTPGVKDTEAEGFKNFIAGKPNHPRFKHLPDRAIDEAFVRWNQGENPKNIDTSEAIKNEREKLKANPSVLFQSLRPNLFLTDLLYHWTSTRYFEDLKKTPGGKRKILLIYWANSCAYEKISEAFPKDEANPYAVNSQTETRLYKQVLKTDPFAHWPSIFTPQEISHIQKRSGPWNHFFKSFLLQELNMESGKLERMEKIFGGKGSLILSSPDQEAESRPTLELYHSFTSKIPQTASLIGSESDNLLSEALAAYISKGLDADLSQAATNMARVPTLREGGLKTFIKKAQSFFPPKKEGYFYSCFDIEDALKN